MPLFPSLASSFASSVASFPRTGYLLQGMQCLASYFVKRISDETSPGYELPIPCNVAFAELTWGHFSIHLQGNCNLPCINWGF